MPLFPSFRLVVGAPVANTSSDHSVSPGAVLRCSIAAAGPRKCHHMTAGVCFCQPLCLVFSPCVTPAVDGDETQMRDASSAKTSFIVLVL